MRSPHVPSEAASPYMGIRVHSHERSFGARQSRECTSAAAHQAVLELLFHPCSMETETRGDHRQKAAAKAGRKDAKLEAVAISERWDKKAAKFSAASLPYPFNSKEAFEGSMRQPLGADFNTHSSFRSGLQHRGEEIGRQATQQPPVPESFKDKNLMRAVPFPADLLPVDGAISTGPDVASGIPQGDDQAADNKEHRLHHSAAQVQRASGPGDGQDQQAEKPESEAYDSHQWRHASSLKKVTGG